MNKTNDTGNDGATISRVKQLSSKDGLFSVYRVVEKLAHFLYVLNSYVFTRSNIGKL